MLIPRDLIPPVPPDFSICRESYGTEILPADCQIATDMLPRGGDAISFYPGTLTEANRLPLSKVHGTCAISVELAGPPEPSRHSIQLVPDQIRGMAGWVINACAIGEDGSGGFVTNGLDSLLRMSDALALRLYFDGQENWPWPINPPTNRPRPGPINVPRWIPPTLVTVTITGPQGKLPKAGDIDPNILVPLIDMAEVRMRAGRWTLEAQHFAGIYEALVQRHTAMGGRLTWWQDFRGRSAEMDYVCDAKLGAPTERDCTKLHWQSLGAPSDTVTIGPTAPEIFTSNSCGLVVSATKATVLTWAQIRTALEALMNVCIDYLGKKPQGGRAYYQRKPQPHYKRIGNDNPLTGLNALPPHVNMTIFQHNPQSKVDCEWQAAQNRKPLASCMTA